MEDSKGSPSQEQDTSESRGRSEARPKKQQKLQRLFGRGDSSIFIKKQRRALYISLAVALIVHLAMIPLLMLDIQLPKKPEKLLFIRLQPKKKKLSLFRQPKKKKQPTAVQVKKFIPKTAKARKPKPPSRRKLRKKRIRKNRRLSRAIRRSRRWRQRKTKPEPKKPKLTNKTIIREKQPKQTKVNPAEAPKKKAIANKKPVVRKSKNKRYTKKQLAGLDLRPKAPVLSVLSKTRRGRSYDHRRGGGKKGRKMVSRGADVGIRKHGGKKSLGTLWPEYHRNFYARRKANDGLHDYFYTKVTKRLRRCWRPLMPLLVAAYKKRYSMAKRQFASWSGKKRYPGLLRIIWRFDGTRPKIFWKLPRISSPVSFMNLPKRTRLCLRLETPPKHLAKRHRQIEARWKFNFTVGVNRPGVMKPLVHRKDPDRVPDTGSNEPKVFVDLGSLIGMWKTRAKFDVQLDAVYQ